MSGQIHSGVEEVLNVSTVIDEKQTLNTQTEVIKRRFPYACEMCNVNAMSIKVFQKHLESKKHTMREQRKGKTFSCELCEMVANSQNQLEVHLRSSRHKAKVARKERLDFMTSSYSKGTWIILFGVVCTFINLLVLFKMYL